MYRHEDRESEAKRLGRLSDEATRIAVALAEMSSTTEWEPPDLRVTGTLVISPDDALGGYRYLRGVDDRTSK